MDIDILFGTKPPLKHELLMAYTLKALNFCHPSFLGIIDVCIDEKGQWALLMPAISAAVLSRFDFGGGLGDLKMVCSIGRTLAEGLIYLRQSELSEGYVFDRENGVYFSRCGKDLSVVLQPPTPEHFAAGCFKQPDHRQHLPGSDRFLDKSNVGTSMDESEKGDVYLLGTILFELITGCRFNQEGDLDEKAFSSRVQSFRLAENEPDSSEVLIDTIKKSLSCSASIRPSMGAFLDLMIRFGGEFLKPPQPKVINEEKADPQFLTSLSLNNTIKFLSFAKEIQTDDRPNMISGIILVEKSSPTVLLPKKTPIIPSRPALLPLRSTDSRDPVLSSPGSEISPGRINPVYTRQAETPGGESVDFSVLAPQTVTCGQMFLVQVFLHAPDAADAARTLGIEFDPTAKRLGISQLDIDLLPGSSIMVELYLPGMEIEEPVQRITWKNRTTSIQFGVSVPPDAQPGPLLGKITLRENGIPVGSLRFRLEIVSKSIGAATLTPQHLECEQKRYRQAFISYSSRDRDDVIKRVQMLARFNIPFFQDILNLEPGERWEQQLYKHIDTCDIFLLFWSSASKASQWVDKEVRYALACKESSQTDTPEIIPILIEGPPVPLPPEHLSHLHFNDRLLYFLDKVN